MLNLTPITPPSVMPVELDQLKSNLRIYDDADDVMLRALIKAATNHLDGRFGALGRALITQTWDMHLKSFPSVRSKLRLPLPPLQSVTSIKYMDMAGQEQLMDLNDLAVSTGEYIGSIGLKNGVTWPRDMPNDNWPVTVRFVAGFGDEAASVPAALAQAIILLASHWYENRLAVEACTLKETPMAFKSLINPYRVSTI